MNDSDVIIYTDGSSRGNPGPGGYGIVMEHCKSGMLKNIQKDLSLQPTTGWSLWRS
jgi:ribonuclease HI